MYFESRTGENNQLTPGSSNVILQVSNGKGVAERPVKDGFESVSRCREVSVTNEIARLLL